MKSNDCTDEIFDMYHVCPTCGESSGLYYDMQYPTFRKIGLDGKPFEIKNGKRTKKKSQCTVKPLFTTAICMENFSLRFVYAKNVVGKANHCQLLVDYHKERRKLREVE